MTTKPQINPRALLARLVLVAFVVGGLFYFTSAFPVVVDVSLRLPYKVMSSEGNQGIRRRDVREIKILFKTEQKEQVAETRLYFDAGVGPEPTPPARLSLVPGVYSSHIRLEGAGGQTVQLTREVQVAEEGEMVLDLR